MMTFHKMKIKVGYKTKDKSMKNSWKEEKKILRTRLKRKLKTATKYQKKSAALLSDCLKGEREKHLAELLQSSLYKITKGMRKITLSDWLEEGKEIELELDPALKPHEEVALRFKKARKKIKGLPHAERELALSKEKVQEMKTLLEKLEGIETEELFKTFKEHLDLPPPQSKKVQGILPPRKPYQEVIAPDGTLIWVGRSAKDNDELTFRYASGNDLWAHATGVSGSHVVAKIPKGGKVSEEALQMVLREAILHSKARNAKEGEVSVTQVKFVKKHGSSKGKVQIANEKRYFVRL